MRSPRRSAPTRGDQQRSVGPAPLAVREIVRQESGGRRAGTRTFTRRPVLECEIPGRETRQVVVSRVASRGSCGASYSFFAAAAGPDLGQAGDPSRSPPLAVSPMIRPSLTTPFTETNPMDATPARTPADEAAEEAARAVQTALDRRDNGGAAGR